ncbi:hypothetical protein NIES208_06450 [[Limnothrix rosea] IAM M-220]|nr:hypothetical protein NIES208_06450 [[Limnothrix rosea] IAM M-220]
MLAYRHFLTISTSSVVIFGSGGLAIAQETPATVVMPVSAAEFTQQPIDLLEIGEPAVSHNAKDTEKNLVALNLNDFRPIKSDQSVVIAPELLANIGSLSAPQIELAAAFPQGSIQQQPPAITSKTLLTRVPVDTSEAIANPVPAQATAQDSAIQVEVLEPNSLVSATLALKSQPVTQRISLLKPLPNEGSLMPANVMTKVAVLPERTTQPETFKHLGEFSPAIAPQKVMTAESKTVAVAQPQPETEVTFIAQGTEDTVPTLPREIAPAETVAAPEEPEQMAETPRRIPSVSEIPEEFRINEELQRLLSPIDDDLLIPPTEAGQVLASEILNLTLAETVERALAANQDLREAQLTYERAKFSLREAIAAEYPTLTSQTDLVRSETAGAELQAERIGNDESEASTSLNSRLELSYDIYTGGRRSGQIDAASTQLKITELDVERIAKETRLIATTTYYDLQSASAQTAIEESAVVEASRSLRDAEQLEEAGLGTKFDVLRAQVEVANAQQRLTRAYASQNTVRRQLAQLLNLPSNADPRAADEIDLAGRWELSLEESILLALQQREELRQQLLQREIDGYQKEIALANIRPQVSVFANYDLLEIYDDDLDTADGFSVGARVRWNLFDGGAANARADQEEVDQAIAENRFLNRSDQIRLAVETAYFNLEASERNIQTASVAVDLADESLRLARLRFRAGVGTQTDVISAQTELTTAQNNLEQAITDYNRSYAQLKREVSVGEEIEVIPAN